MFRAASMLSSMLLLAAAAAGCFSPVEEFPPDGSADGGQGGVARVDSLAGVTGDCDGGGLVHPYGSIPQLQSLMVGRWKFCSGTPSFNEYGPNWDQVGVGVQIDAVGIVNPPNFTVVGPSSFEVLVATDGGEWVPASGFNSGGTLGVQTSDQSVLFLWNGGGGGGARPAFTDNPAQVLLADAVYTLMP